MCGVARGGVARAVAKAMARAERESREIRLFVEAVAREADGEQTNGDGRGETGAGRRVGGDGRGETGAGKRARGNGRG